MLTASKETTIMVGNRLSFVLAKTSENGKFKGPSRTRSCCHGNSRDDITYKKSIVVMHISILRPHSTRNATL